MNKYGSLRRYRWLLEHYICNHVILLKTFPSLGHIRNTLVWFKEDSPTLPRKSLWHQWLSCSIFHLWRSSHISAKFLSPGPLWRWWLYKFPLWQISPWGAIMDVDGENASCQDYNPLRMWRLRVWKLSSAF